MAQTPEQWRVNPSGNISNGEFTIAELAGIYAEKAEYARLIAAAPALLAALEALLAPEANKQVEMWKLGLFKVAPEIEALARNAVELAKQAP